jgi:Ca2+-binding RTX toxin-like protein
MPLVTVAGAHGKFVTLSFDSASNATLAKQLASAITAGVEAHTILPADSSDGPPPALHGATGEWIQSTDGLTMLPKGYDAVVNTSQHSVIFGSGDNSESVLSSTGNLDFFATGGSGTVVAGGGDNLISVPTTDKGKWGVYTGNGDDTLLLTGSGNDTIDPGGGHNFIQLGDGKSALKSSGDDSVLAGSGSETIAAFGKNSDLIYGIASKLDFIGDQGSASIFGGSGSDTFFGGSGTNLVYGGSGGNNLLFAGMGNATLFGGGSGDQLFTQGGKAQALHAGAGNETLFGGAGFGADTFYAGPGHDQVFGGIGNDTFVAGTGAATITAVPGNDRFVFVNGQAGGTDSIQGFMHGLDKVDLQGYGKNEVTKALKSQHVVGTNDTITLSDDTKITFANTTMLTADDFVTNGGGAVSVGGSGGGGHHHDHDHDHGRHGHGSGDFDRKDHGSASDHLYGHS